MSKFNLFGKARRPEQTYEKLALYGRIQCTRLWLNLNCEKIDKRKQKEEKHSASLNEKHKVTQ